MSKLDDFLSKKKETTVILDLSKATANSKEEFRRLFDKVPDFKIRPVKVKSEDIKIREKDLKFKTTKKDLKKLKEPYNFMDPMPSEMKGVKVDELAAVPIDWRMLTSQRPKTKLEEDMFTRMVELAKLEQKTRARDRKISISNPPVRKWKNKAGVVETRVQTCKECGEEFCDGTACVNFQYDCFSRVEETSSKVKDKHEAAVNGSKGKNKLKKKRKPRTKSKGGARSKSKSPSKPRTKSPIKQHS